MSKGLRLSEKWFRAGLWIVALIFASFLIGLGNTVVRHLQLAEPPLSLDDFMDKTRAPLLREKLAAAQESERTANDALERARLAHEKAQADSRSAESTFQNWVATRTATAQPEQDTELIARTKELDELKAAERRALALVEAQEQARLNAQQSAQTARDALTQLQEAALGPYKRAQDNATLMVFLYRLALTLPLLLLAGYLFAKKRKSTYWPFVWGFIFFALFAFFVELVPYLPSYGGYVRYVVGIIITALVGRWAIVALNRYLERQRAAESQPEQERRKALAYDVALDRLGKSVCPGCERKVDLKDGVTDFCPHCGIGLFDYCGNCKTRKNAFAHYCHACGATADAPAAAPAAGAVAPVLSAPAV